MQYKTCPNCGANLDPGERCDCQDLPGLTRMSDYTDPTFGTLPLYEMGGFINTLEGWKMFASGDMERYSAAKAEWEQKAAASAENTDNGQSQTKLSATPYYDNTTPTGAAQEGGNS